MAMGLKRVVSKGRVYYYPRVRYTEVSDRHKNNLADFMVRMLPIIKERAKQAGLCFSLTIEDLHSMLERQGYRCAVTGIDFEFGSRDRSHFRADPWRPSVDRIDPASGYVTENCRIVCVAVNLALNQWGDEILYRIAKGIVEKRKTASEKRKTRCLPD